MEGCASQSLESKEYLAEMIFRMESWIWREREKDSLDGKRA